MSLLKLYDELSTCTACRRSASSPPVSGPGKAGPVLGVLSHPSAEASLVGEALYGLEGESMRKLLKEAGLEVSLWTHAVKCGGPTPKLHERGACARWLGAELELSRPTLALCMGPGAYGPVMGAGVSPGDVFAAMGTTCAAWHSPHRVLSGGKKLAASTVAFLRRLKEARC